MASNTNPSDLPQVTLLSALHSKYSDDEPADLGFEICIPKSAPGKKASGALLIPKCLSLNDYHITTLGNIDEVADFCSGVLELDLTKNDINDINDVVHVAERLPHLSFLNMCSNPLQISLNQEFQPNTNIKTLVLNNSQVTMGTIQQLMEIFTDLQELHLSLSNYTSVTLDKDKPHANLKSLHFNNNKVTDWPELCKLGYAFPNLETLFITETNLESFDMAEETGVAFPKLKALRISKTRINSWDEIDKLDRCFPALTDVRLTGIPILGNFSEKERLHFLLARLPRILMLNGSRVQEETRIDGERAFIRYYMDREDKPSRFYDLQKKHGKLYPLVNVALGPTSDPYVKITFHDKVKMMQLTLKQTVGDLKKTLKEFCGLRVSCMQLVYTKPGAYYYNDLLTNPQKMLYSLRIEDGDCFFIYNHDENPYQHTNHQRPALANVSKTTECTPRD